MPGGMYIYLIGVVVFWWFFKRSIKKGWVEEPADVEWAFAPIVIMGSWMSVLFLVLEIFSRKTGGND